MELICGKCFVCKENENVLRAGDKKPFLKFIVNTYFDSNIDQADKFKTCIRNQSLCVACACNIETSFKFKKTYEEKLRFETTTMKSRSCCFMCGYRGMGIVLTESNPNQFNENINLFMKVISKPRLYAQCAICFVCTLELQNFSKIHASIQEEMKGCNINAEKGTEIATRNTPRRAAALKSIHALVKRPIMDVTPSSEVPSTKRAKTTAGSPFLSNLLSVKEFTKTFSLTISNNLIRDKKMYTFLPYIKIEQFSEKVDDKKLINTNVKIQPTKEVTEEVEKCGNNTTEVMEISCSEKIKDETRTEQNRPFRSPKPKVEIKIKFSKKPRTVKACPKSKKIINVHQCTVCNNSFSTYCQLLSHLLHHDKPENLMVKLTRTPLSKGKNEKPLEEQKKTEQFDNISKESLEEKVDKNKEESAKNSGKNVSTSDKIEEDDVKDDKSMDGEQHLLSCKTIDLCSDDEDSVKGDIENREGEGGILENQEKGEKKSDEEETNNIGSILDSSILFDEDDDSFLSNRAEFVILDEVEDDEVVEENQGKSSESENNVENEKEKESTRNDPCKENENNVQIVEEEKEEEKEAEHGEKEREKEEDIQDSQDSCKKNEGEQVEKEKDLIFEPGEKETDKKTENSQNSCEKHEEIVRENETTNKSIEIENEDSNETEIFDCELLSEKNTDHVQVLDDDETLTTSNNVNHVSEEGTKSLSEKNNLGEEHEENYEKEQDEYRKKQVKEKEEESTEILEAKLRLIMGETLPSNDKDVSTNKQDVDQWDEACRESDIFSSPTVNTILKKNWNKSLEESPRTNSKKVRFAVETEDKGDKTNQDDPIQKFSNEATEKCFTL